VQENRKVQNLIFEPEFIPKPIEIFRERVCLPCGQYDLYRLRQSSLPQSIVSDFSTSFGIQDSKGCKNTEKTSFLNPENPVDPVKKPTLQFSC